MMSLQSQAVCSTHSALQYTGQEVMFELCTKDSPPHMGTLHIRRIIFTTQNRTPSSAPVVSYYSLLSNSAFSEKEKKKKRTNHVPHYECGV